VFRKKDKEIFSLNSLNCQLVNNNTIANIAQTISTSALQISSLL